jgi:hypothetical protein
MNTRSACLSLVAVVCLGLHFCTGSIAAVTVEHKKQIADVKKDLTKVNSLITKKDFDDADKLLGECEQKLKQTAKDAGIDDSNKLISAEFKKVEQLREMLTKKRPAGGAAAGGGSVSFERDVAPILAARCLNCHGANNPRGRLRMDTFDGIVQGGGSGVLLVPNKPAESVLVQRISADGDERMPKNAPALSAEEIKKISDWIAGGAKFSGNNATPIVDLKAAAAAKRETTPVQINKPTGTETVSFTKDIAPFMSNLCVNCHSGNNPRSGFSLETFEKLMQGGKSGRVVLPGNSKDSRLWHLVGEQDPIKMPQGQALITPTNHRNLKTWIEEGAKFDGPDPKATLRSLVPTDAEKRAKELASLSNDELARRRKERAHDLWKAALPNDSPAEQETDGFFVLGNASEARLKQIADWSGSDADSLRKLFKIKDAIWRGKLTVFVFKDRFSYSEFAQTNERVEIPADTKGHSRVSSLGDEAYICLLDIGDAATEESPGMRTQLMGLLAEALLQRASNRVPDWAAKGTGLVLAARSDAKNPYFRGLNAAAHEALRAIDKPEELFANGTFSPSDLAPVGYTLVSFMLKQGGEGHFVEFLREVSEGKSLSDSLKSIYNVDVVSLARAYGQFVEGLPGAKASAKKKK